MAGSVVVLALLPVTAALVIVYRPHTLKVQKSFTWFQSRSLARKSASAVDRVFSDVDALRSFEARWLDSRPGMAIAAMIAMIAITIISSINVKPLRLVRRLYMILLLLHPDPETHRIIASPQPILNAILNLFFGPLRRLTPRVLVP